MSGPFGLGRELACSRQRIDAGPKSGSGKSLGRVVGKPDKCPRKWAMQLRKCRTSRSRAMLAIAAFIMRLCAAEHRCFPACIVRKPVLSVVADLVNSETSSQVGTPLCSPERETGTLKIGFSDMMCDHCCPVKSRTE